MSPNFISVQQELFLPNLIKQCIAYLINLILLDFAQFYPTPTHIVGAGPCARLLLDMCFTHGGAQGPRPTIDL